MKSLWDPDRILAPGVRGVREIGEFDMGDCARPWKHKKLLRGARGQLNLRCLIRLCPVQGTVRSPHVELAYLTALRCTPVQDSMGRHKSS